MAGPSEKSSEECPACYGSTALLQWNCGHVMCKTCVTTQLATKWPGSLVGFAYLSCALCRQPLVCQQPLANRDIEQQLNEHRQFQQRVVRIAREKFVEYGLAIELNEKLGRDATEEELDAHASESMAVYMCSECKQPYCGGRVNRAVNQRMCHECVWVALSPSLPRDMTIEEFEELIKENGHLLQINLEIRNSKLRQENEKLEAELQESNNKLGGSWPQAVGGMGPPPPFGPYSLPWQWPPPPFGPSWQWPPSVPSVPPPGFQWTAPTGFEVPLNLNSLEIDSKIKINQLRQENEKLEAKLQESNKQADLAMADIGPPPGLGYSHSHPGSFGSSSGSPTEELTTVMMRNIPNTYTRVQLQELLEKKGYGSTFDLLYLPLDDEWRNNLGYAFINFTTHELAEKFCHDLRGFDDWGANSHKKCDVNWSRILQGLPAHIERYRNSPVMHESVPDEFKPMLFKDGKRTAFPEPTKRIRPPRRWMRTVFPEPTKRIRPPRQWRDPPPSRAEAINLVPPQPPVETSAKASAKDNEARDADRNPTSDATGSDSLGSSGSTQSTGSVSSKRLPRSCPDISSFESLNFPCVANPEADIDSRGETKTSGIDEGRSEEKVVQVPVQADVATGELEENGLFDCDTLEQAMASLILDEDKDHCEENRCDEDKKDKDIQVETEVVRRTSVRRTAVMQFMPVEDVL